MTTTLHWTTKPFEALTLAELYAIQNDAEIQALLATHYTSKAQTLTSGTEANLRELLGTLTLLVVITDKTLVVVKM